MPKSTDFYAGRDPRALPAYPLAEAARYLRLAPATLRSWVAGRAYPRRGGVGHFRALIRLPQRGNSQLSFWNLIEAHVLRALRTEHGVPIKAVRTAMRYAEEELKIDQLLLNPALCTAAGELFLDKYGALVSLSRSGQLAMRKVFEAHLKRLEWDTFNVPIRLFPFIRDDGEAAPRPIVIDPLIAFGRPVVARRGVSTAVIADRIDAGESPEEVARDYELETHEVEEAVVYERAA